MKTHGHHQSWLDGFVSPDNIVTVLAALAAVGLAALLASWQYRKQKEKDRKDARAQVYAQALQVVEDYLETPYLVMRRNGDSPESLVALTTWISEVQSRLQFSRAWMDVHAPDDIRECFDTLVRTAKREAGPQMTDAWNSPPKSPGEQVPIGEAPRRDASDKARSQLVELMRADLRID